MKLPGPRRSPVLAIGRFVSRDGVALAHQTNPIRETLVTHDVDARLVAAAAFELESAPGVDAEEGGERIAAEAAPDHHAGLGPLVFGIELQNARADLAV